MATITNRARWDFRCDNQRWIWQRINPDGSVTRPSGSHATLHIAADDAKQHGFKPDMDDFLIDDTYTMSYFTPNEAPKHLAKNA